MKTIYDTKCTCGCDRFIAWVPISGTVPVIVDSEGNCCEYLFSVEDLSNHVCMEPPYAPYQCADCGKKHGGKN